MMAVVMTGRQVQTTRMALQAMTPGQSVVSFTDFQQRIRNSAKTK